MALHDPFKSLQHVDSVNIENYPQIDKNYPFDKGAQLTLGDLHGNALKLFYTLIRHGVISNLSKEDYATFNRLYKRTADEITKNDIQWFKSLIRKIKVNGKGTLRLIGDDLADRGANDFFTLAILGKLFKSTHVEIIVSNHSLEFIRAYEKAATYVSENLMFGQAASMQNLQQLITRKLIDRKEIDTIMSSQYMPNVKLLSYTLDEKNGRIAIFSHAPIGIECMQAIAAKMGVEFKDNSMNELAQTIENINKTFNEKYVKTKTVHTLFDNEVVVGRPEDVDPKVAPFTHLIWNRNHEVNRPESHKGYKMKWIHGHDARPTNILHRIYNLDNHLGKGNSTEGAYNVHYTHEKQLGAPKVFAQVEEDEIVDDLRASSSFMDTVKAGLHAFRDTFFAPSKHPFITGALAATLAIGVSVALALTPFNIIACGVMTALTVATTLRAKDHRAQAALQSFSATPRATQTPVAKEAFKQGAQASKGWIPYARANFRKAAWKDKPAFAAGMESELSKPRI